MAAPDGSGFENLPSIIQYAITAGVGVAVAIAAGWTYLKRLAKAPEPEKKTDFVVTAAQFADMGPVREQARILGDILVEARASREALTDILAHLNEIEQDRKINREVERRLHDALLEKARQIDVSRPRHRKSDDA